jgi:hypothetical protein
MSQNLSQNPKSIKQLQEKLYKINNDYKGSITEIIKRNKSIDINKVITQNNITQDFYLEEINQNNNNVLNNIKDKIVLFNNLIDELKKIKELKNIKPSKKWKIKLNAYGNRTKPTNTTTKRNYQPNVNNTVQKYIDYLEYLKKILETKLVNDIKIINLFKQVISSNTEKILQLINEISELNKEKKKKEEKENEQTKKLITEKKQKKLNEKLDECSIKIKPKLNTLSKLSNIKYNTELTTHINKVKLDNELKICSKKIEEKLNSLINTLDNINVPIVLKKGGSNFEITNAIIQKLKLVNVSESEDYTGKLKNIKQTYEKGLKENIDQYKKICKALTDYIKDLQQIIKGLLSSFIDEKKEFNKKQEQYFENKRKEIIEINNEINKIINEKFKEKIEFNKKGETIKSININIINNRDLRQDLENIILEKDFFNNDEKILILTHELIKTIDDDSKYYIELTKDEIRSLVPQIKEQLLKYKKLLEELYSSNENYV